MSSPMVVEAEAEAEAEGVAAREAAVGLAVVVAAEALAAEELELAAEALVVAAGVLAVVAAVDLEAVRELAPVELARERELAAPELLPEQELVPAQELAAEAIMLSEILTPAHTDRLTRTVWAGECFRCKGAMTPGFVADGLPALLVGMCGGMRHTCAISSDLTKASGSMLRSRRTNRCRRCCSISNPLPVPERMTLRRPVGHR